MSNRPQDYDGNSTLTTVIRFHNRERLPLLEGAINSLATQDWKDFELVVAVQNPDAALLSEIERIIGRQVWAGGPRYRLVPVEIPPGVDGRGDVMTRGIEAASGRFLAFLDDDDVVYRHGYATLAGRLLAGDKVIAVGGYRKAYLVREGGGWRVVSRAPSLVPAPSRITLFRYNYIPPHTYVIDRSRLGGFRLYFDNDMPPLEDYDFLLRLCALFEPDFTCFDVPVSEYRIHELNTIGAALDRPDEQSPALRRAHRLIAERKKTLRCTLTVAEVADLAEQAARLSGEHERLVHRLAGRANAAVDRRPRLKSSLRRLRAALGVGGG